MQEQIKWLIGIEQMAGKLYREAADFFKEDEGLSNFLNGLAEDEALHFHILGSAAEYIRSHPETKPLHITLDDETRNRIDSPFHANYQKLKDGQGGRFTGAIVSQ